MRVSVCMCVCACVCMDVCAEILQIVMIGQIALSFVCHLSMSCRRFYKETLGAIVHVEYVIYKKVRHLHFRCG